MTSDGGGRAGAAPATRRGLLTGVALVLGLVVVLLAAAAVGPWDAPRGGGETVTGSPVPTPSLPFTPPSVVPTVEVTEPAAGQQENPLVRWLVIAVVALVGVVLLALVLRLVVGLLRRSPLPEPDAHHVTAALADESVDAPTMLDGIARAQRLLDEERAPRDAIVQAWLALEHAASRAGVGRRPAQTPTEFTAVVLERTPADRDAVEVLRALYLRVRFSDDELLPGDAEAARQALTAIGASWAELTEAAP